MISNLQEDGKKPACPAKVREIGESENLFNQRKSRLSLVKHDGSHRLGGRQ